jgi:hypothetical protein
VGENCEVMTRQRKRISYIYNLKQEKLEAESNRTLQKILPTWKDTNPLLLILEMQRSSWLARNKYLMLQPSQFLKIR